MARKADDDGDDVPLIVEPALDSRAEAQRLIAVLNEQLERARRRKRTSPRDLAALTGQILSARRFLDDLPRASVASPGGTPATKGDLLRNMPDDLLLSLLAFADGQRYELPERYAPLLPTPVAVQAPPPVVAARPTAAGLTLVRDEPAARPVAPAANAPDDEAERLARDAAAIDAIVPARGESRTVAILRWRKSQQRLKEMAETKPSGEPSILPGCY